MKKQSTKDLVRVFNTVIKGKVGSVVTIHA